MRVDYLLAVLTVVLVFGIGPSRQLNYNKPEYVDFDYTSPKFMRNKVGYEFCAAVPRPPTMEFIQVNDFVYQEGVSKCKPYKFIGHVIVSVLTPLIIIFLLGIFTCCCAPIICILRYKKGFFGGGRPSSIRGPYGLLLPGDEKEALNTGYNRREITVLKVCVLLALFTIIIGIGAVFVGTSLVSNLVYEVEEIFLDYPRYMNSTVSQVGASLLQMEYTQGHSTKQAVAAAEKEVHKFHSKAEDNVSIQLYGIANAYSALMYLTCILVFFSVLFGIAAAMFRLPKLAIGLAFFLLLVSMLVWGGFTATYAANNILADMCDVINGCHFCITGQYASDSDTCEKCETTWFQVMQNCTEDAQNMFSDLTNVAEKGLTTATDNTCTAITDLCTDVKNCIYPYGTCASEIGSTGVNGVVFLTTDDTTYMTVEQLSKTTTDPTIQTQAEKVLSLNDLRLDYEYTVSQMTSTNCGAANAFIETDPGTFNRLQQAVCPAAVHVEYSIYDRLIIVGCGLILLGIALPCFQLCLCLGDKRFHRRDNRAPILDEDEAVGLINNGMVLPERSTSISPFG